MTATSTERSQVLKTLRLPTVGATSTEKMIWKDCRRGLSIWGKLQGRMQVSVSVLST